MMKKLFALALMFFFIGILSLYAAEEKKVIPANFSGQDSALIAQKLSAAQSRMKQLIDNNIDCSDLMSRLAETQKKFDELKSSLEIKDPAASRDLLLASIESIEARAAERMLLNRRMDVIYQIMVILGMLAIVLMIVYSIYMYSKRK